MSNFIAKVFVFAPFSLKFYLNYKVSIRIQDLSSTHCNFQGLSRCVRTVFSVSKVSTQICYLKNINLKNHKNPNISCCNALQQICQRGSILDIFILLHGKFLQFDWLRAVAFQLNLKYLHVKITNLLRVVV